VGVDSELEEQRMWVFVFIIVIVIGTVFIVLNPLGIDGIIRDGYRLVSIFLGMLAGIALGEVFKIRNNKKSARTLFVDLIEELKVNVSLLDKDMLLRKGFWVLGIRSGRVEFMPQDKRRLLWEIYSRVTHYNEDLGLIHQKMIVQGKEALRPEMREELDQFKDEIRAHINKFLQLYAN
jgi:hypothetical protein